MKDLPALHTFKITYMAPTKMNGAIIKLESLYFYSKTKIAVKHSSLDIFEQAIEYLESKGINCIAKSNTAVESYIHSDTFINPFIKKEKTNG